MLNNSVSNKSFIIKTLLYGSAIAAIVVALLLISFIPQNIAYADTEESYINFNQIAPTMNSSNYVRYTEITNTAISYGQNSFTINNNGANNSSYQYGFVSNNNIHYTSGHRYYISMDVLCSYNGGVRLELWAGYSQLTDINTIANETVKCRQIVNCQTTTNRTMLGYISGSSDYPNGTTTYSNLMIIDLTLCFGESKANTLTIEDINSIFPSPYYDYTIGLILSQTAIDQYSLGYNNGVSDTLASFVINNTVTDSYNLITTVNYNNQPTSAVKQIIDVDGQQMYAVICNGLAKLPFTVRANTTLKLDIGKFDIWTSDPDNTTYYDIYYLYNGNLINLYSKSGPKNQTSVSGHFEFYIPVDIDGIIFECSDQYMLVNISAEYQTYNLQTAINKSLESGQQNGYDLGFKDGKAEGYDLGLRSDSNLVNGGFWTFFSSMITNVSSLFNIELFGGITIGTLLLIPLLFTVLLLILRLVRGGE